MNVREYRDKDKEELIGLIDEFNNYIFSVESKGLARKFLDKKEAEEYTDQIIKDAKEMNGFIYLLEEPEKTAGFIMGIINDNRNNVLHHLTHLPYSDGWIGIVYIGDKYRGKGYGKLLIDKANNYFKESGCKYSRLLVLCDNENSVDVYKKLGYETRDLELAKEL